MLIQATFQDLGKAKRSQPWRQRAEEPQNPHHNSRNWLPCYSSLWSRFTCSFGSKFPPPAAGFPEVLGLNLSSFSKFLPFHPMVPAFLSQPTLDRWSWHSLQGRYYLSAQPLGLLSNMRGKETHSSYSPSLSYSQMKAPQIQPQGPSPSPVFLGVWVLGKWPLQGAETDGETLREPGLLWGEALLWGDCPQLFHLLFWGFVWKQDLHGETDLLCMNETVGVVKPQDIWGEAKRQTFRQSPQSLQTAIFVD